MLRTGSRVGAYEVGAPIGSGGMGDVYSARDARLDRDAALKVLPIEFANDHDRLTRFKREAKLLASLSHPNIAQVYGLEECEGTYCIAMELIRGETLADRLRRRLHHQKHCESAVTLPTVWKPRTIEGSSIAI